MHFWDTVFKFMWELQNLIRKKKYSHQGTSPTTWLRVWIVRHINFVFITIHKEASCFSFPLIINFGDRNHPDLVSLSQYFLLRKLARVTCHQLSGCHLDHFIIKCLHWTYANILFLKCNLATYISYQVIRNIQFFSYMLTRIDPPGDGKLNETQNVGCPLTSGTTYFASGLWKENIQML